MNPPNRQQPPRNVPVVQPPNPQVTNEIIQGFLVNQQLEAQNEAARIQLRSKEIDANSVYAQQSLKHQAEYINNKGKEQRRNMRTLALIAGGFTLVLLGFVVYCLYIGEREFISAVLKGLSYLVTTGMGYYFGQRNVGKTKSPGNDSTSAEVVND